MKLFIVAASMILSASAMAASSTVIHGYSQVLGSIKLNNACITESEVKSINPVRVCTKLVPHTVDNGGEIGSHTDWVCANWETKDLAASRAFERTVCLKHAPINEASSGECLKYGTVSDFLPATIKITTVTNHGEASTERQSWFSFPACE